MNKSVVGRRIRQVRIAKGMKPAELAHAVSVSPSSINQWELGRQPVSQPMLVRLAHVLAVTPRYLETGYDDDRSTLTVGDKLVQILADAQARLVEASGMSPGQVELVLTFRQGGSQ